MTAPDRVVVGTMPECPWWCDNRDDPAHLTYERDDGTRNHVGRVGNVTSYVEGGSGEVVVTVEQFEDTGEGKISRDPVVIEVQDRTSESVVSFETPDEARQMATLLIRAADILDGIKVSG
jgi:hypothetical protein